MTPWPTRITILGLGLIGGSLAQALQTAPVALIGVDADPNTRQQAAAAGCFERVTASPADVLPQTDLLILAAPVRVNLRMLSELPQLTAAGLNVLDVSSTKQAILAAMDALPPRFAALGGHPMCGKEIGGWPAAAPGLFRGARFVLTRSRRTTPQLTVWAETLIAHLGAEPLWLDAATHDAWAAAISHLPYLLSVALALTAPPEAAPLVSSGYRSTARLAGSDPRMMADILLTNRDRLLPLLQMAGNHLQQIAKALATADERALLALLRSAKSKRAALLENQAVS